MNATEGADYCIDCLLAWSGDKQSGSVDESKNSKFPSLFLKIPHIFNNVSYRPFLISQY